MNFKLPLFFIATLCVASCSNIEKKSSAQKKEAKVESRIVQPKFQSIIDAADVVGSILIYDDQKNTYYSNDFEWANKGKLPASTFKIANSIIGLESGVIESDSTIFKWDGEQKMLKNWEQDLVLRDAFHFSCVPCYQELARKIGEKRMNDYLKKLNYGTMKVDADNIDLFWLGGDSRINQLQQIDFLKRFYDTELPISARTEKIMKKMMVINETDLYTLSGKTGLSMSNETRNGWFVGYIELNTTTYFFATNIEPKKEFNFDTFAQQRIDVTLKALKQMGITIQS